MRAIRITADWTPTKENVDALPAPIRKYVRQLQVQRDGLALRLREVTEEVLELRKPPPIKPWR